MSSLSQLLLVLVATFPFLSVCGVHEEHLMSSCVWAFSFSFLSRDGAYFPKIAMKLWTLCLKSNTKKKFTRVEVFVLLTASGCLYKDRNYHVLYLQCLTHSQLVSPIFSHFYLQISYSFSDVWGIAKSNSLDFVTFWVLFYRVSQKKSKIFSGTPCRSFLLKKKQAPTGHGFHSSPSKWMPWKCWLAELLNCLPACLFACLLVCC